MKKVILITGATDGIGLATAKMLATQGHDLLIHGRSADKLAKVATILSELPNVGVISSYLADLSQINSVKVLAEQISKDHSAIDVIINNAGVFKLTNPINQAGFDLRFIVNTIAPYLLTKLLLPVMSKSSRVVNLSSAAQAPVDLKALLGQVELSDMAAYSQSKLAITMWTQHMAEKLKGHGPIFFAVNPGSLLASKMVQDGFGVAGSDINIGAKILTRLSTEQGLAEHSGQYFDNDKGQFSAPHPDGLNKQKSAKIVEVIEEILTNH